MTKLFISELDQFLRNWDKEHLKLSETQQAIIQKTENIFNLRDSAQVTEKANSQQPEMQDDAKSTPC